MLELSLFEVLGPVMIGPSSSHTAGAVRLARAAAAIAGPGFVRVRFGLSGSLAKTGAGHGTPQALLAGVLGLDVDDEKIPEAAGLAKERGVQAEYTEEELDAPHENAVHLHFFYSDGHERQVWGCSVGGGRIRVTRVDACQTDFDAQAPTLLVRHADRPGAVSEVSRALAQADINIGLLRLSRESKGGNALLVIETDGPVPAQVVEELRGLRHVTEVTGLALS